MYNIKKFFQLIVAGSLGSVLTLIVFFSFQNKQSDSNLSPQFSGKKVGYEIKNITVPTFDFADVAENVTPSVVYIKVKVEVKENSSLYRRNLDPFEQFFGQDPRMQEGPSMGSGSGVIISDKGYIVTNNHVVGDATNIEVVLNDKRSFKAELVAKDPNTDLALIKINATDLVPIKIGSSDRTRVGEWVLAIGNPFNLTSTVTAGIVSAKARNIQLLGGTTPVESFIQTDAAVNPGNSGGALVNSKGELVGINTAIASQTGSYAGYSFAVPSNLMDKVVKDFLEYGEVQRGFLGVQIKEIDEELAKENNFSFTSGAYVEKVSDNGAADKAGIKKGDIIKSVDGQAIKSVPELQEMVAEHRPGQSVSVKILRGSKEIELNVVLRNKDGKLGIVSNESQTLKKLLGIELAQASEQEKSKLKIGNGLKIQKLNQDGLFKKSGIPEGFIITSVDRMGVYSSNDIYKILDKKKGGIVVEGYLPQGQHKYYLLEME